MTDLPARLLAAVVATLPEHRHDWGRAMTAELAGLVSRADRWRFALSCSVATLRIAPTTATRSGVVAGVVFAAWFVAAVAVDRSEPLWLGVLYVVSPAVVFALPAYVWGWRAAAWTVAVAGPLTFALWFPLGHTFDGEPITRPAAAVFSLVIFPLLGLTAAATGIGLRRALQVV